MINRQTYASRAATNIYVCNVMTQPGETQALPRSIAEEGRPPVVSLRDSLTALGVRIVGANVIGETQTVRHDPTRLADVILKLIDEHVATRSSFVRLTPTPQQTPVTSERAS